MQLTSQEKRKHPELDVITVVVLIMDIHARGMSIRMDPVKSWLQHLGKDQVTNGKKAYY